MESEPTGRARGRFRLHYITDSLWNIESRQKARWQSWIRAEEQSISTRRNCRLEWPVFFMQLRSGKGGGNLGTYLGLGTARVGCRARTAFRLTHGGSKSSGSIHRLDSRIGQIAGQKLLWTQHMEPHCLRAMSYALPNLSTTYETAVSNNAGTANHVAPMRKVYLASMVIGRRQERPSNTTRGTCFLSFKGAPVSAYEIGFTPGNKAHPCAS